jgi:tRNA-splicing ligase RtcB
LQQLAPHLFSWASILADNTRAQAVKAATMPFIYPHLALMPDAHLGKGATVGSVIPTKRAIMPAAVGVDIGCGMNAVRTQWTKDDLAHVDLTMLRRDIEAAIPLSAGVYNEGPITGSAWERVEALSALATRAGFNPDSYTASWHQQLGSLGSGNHFIEVSLDEDDRVWLFLHSGSRGVGNKIAQHHIKVAQDLCKRWYIDLPDKDLAYLIEGTDEFWDYIKQLRWAQEFARENRAEMMDRVKAQITMHLGEDVQAELDISCHHNYTEQETHFGEEVWLSRKGAIDASEGVFGLIPGSMGTRSYVVQGLGSKMGLNSAPHGAGREYSRRQAKGRFTLEALQEAMQGIEWSGSSEFLDEHPGAYKDIDRVMEDAADLVEVQHTLRQLVNVKGD